MNDRVREALHDHRDKEITVETLSSIPIHVRPAPQFSRIAAGFVDSLILVLLLTALHLAERWKNFATLDSTAIGYAYAMSSDMRLLFFFAFVSFGYYFALEGFLGQPLESTCSSC